jgi:segregation and condensation protein A
MLVKNKESLPVFTLSNFEGPLSLLLQLVQKQELEISEISLYEIISQFIKQWEDKVTSDVDNGAEFISLTASLLVLKSKKLLPDVDSVSSEVSEELDTPRAVLSLLIEYLRFKQMASSLGEKEEFSRKSYPRGTDRNYEPSKKLLGIDQLSMDSLQQMFQDVLKRTEGMKRVIHEETWRVSDKIKNLRALLKEQTRVAFKALLYATKSRVELIVTFLATLELMKLGELGVDRDENGEEIWLTKIGIIHDSIK